MTRRSKNKNKIKKKQQKSSEKLHNIKKHMLAETIKVAVYGEYLKKENGNDHEFFKGSKFLGSCESLPLYTMYDLKNFPGVVRNGTTSITLDVYEITRDKLKKFDKMQNYDILENDNTLNTFIRKICWTPFGVAKIYFYNSLENNVKIPRIIKYGNWSQYKKFNN